MKLLPSAASIRRVRRRLVRLLPVLGPLLILLLFFLANVGLSRFDAHRARVTGRTDTPRMLCSHCHWLDQPDTVGMPSDAPRFPNPMALAVARDGSKLFVAASGQDLVLEIDTATNQVTRTLEVGAFPRDLAVAPNGRKLAVACRDADQVQLIDTLTWTVSRTFPVGPEPTGIEFDRQSARLFVANSGSRTIETLDLEPGPPVEYLVAGEEPVALARKASLLCVINRRVRPARQAVVSGSEVTLIDTVLGRVIDRRELRSAHLGRAITLSSDASFALAPVVQFRNQLPLTQVSHGAVMTSALAFVETRPGGRTAEFPLDEVNAFFADPAGVALTPDDRIAFVAHGGANCVTAIDVDELRRLCADATPAELEAFPDDLALSSRYVLARIPTLDVPEALAMSPDGTRLFVAERLSDSIAVIDVESLTVIDRIDLGGPHERTAERRGERVFHDASATFQGQFSCSSCHPEGHTDSIIWDFEIDGVGQNLLETRSLRGIRDTPPFKWNGKNPDLLTQCGPRFSLVLMRSEPFEPARLRDLVAFIESIPLRSRRSPEGTAEASARGEAIFFRTTDNKGQEIPVAHRCSTCHRPPLYTDRFMSDVGTGGKFDTPHLFDVGASAPYLHDGRALTLEEIWTVHSPDDTHGRASDLSKIELNDLVLFLRSL